MSNEKDQITVPPDAIPVVQFSPFVVSTSPDPRQSDDAVMRLVYANFRRDYSAQAES